MGRRYKGLPISYHILVLTLLGFASSDFQQDRTECADQLVGLAPCLPYVGGQAKAPTLDCCSGLKQVLDKSKKCLCVLIKDRDDPNLGIKINATLAATLPGSCHAPINVTDCINLLHLPPSSPDAKAFASYANLTKGSATPAIVSPITSNGHSTGSNSSAQEQSDSESRASHRRLVAEMICGFLLWTFLSLDMYR